MRAILAYDDPVGLLACPFCREMFEEGESAVCPVCGVSLTAFEKLPPSHDAVAEAIASLSIPPEQQAMPLTYLGRGKGALALLSFVGIGLFFLPWIHLTLPYIDARSGFDLAHKRLGWVWATGVAWAVLVPTILSRRSIVQMRGARVAAALLSAIPGACVAILMLRPPPKSALVPIAFTFGWPMWATLLISLIAFGFALRLGGRIDDITVARGTSKGQHLH